MLQLFAGLLLMTAAGTAGQLEAIPTVILRAYDAFGLTIEELRVARGTVETILRRAQFALAWHTCPASAVEAAATDACSDPPGRRDVIVRFVGEPADAGPAGGALGSSHVVPASPGGGSMASVFPSRVRALAGDDPRHRGVLLGRAVAHEVGHLLLNTVAHTRKGLMRGRWTMAEVRLDRDEDWRFTPRELSAMRQGLLVRR